MDAPERADANRAGGDGTGEESETPHGLASAFRRALDAQAKADKLGDALVPTGPHDLTVQIERVRVDETVGDPQPAEAESEAAAEAKARDARIRVPPWSPSIRWVGTAANGIAAGVAEDAHPTAPTAVAVDHARPSREGPADRTERASEAGSPSEPPPNRDEHAKSGRLRLAVVVSAALAATAAISFVLINDESTPDQVSSALPTWPTMSGAAVLPATGLTGGKGSASPSMSGSSTASSKSSSTASPSSSADATATDTTASNAVNGAASPSAAGTGTSAAGAATSAKAANGSALANASTGKCLNTPGSTYSAGAVEQVAACSGNAYQAWTLTSSGQLTQDGGSYCLDDYNWDSTPGSEVDLWPCNGGSNQQWTIESDGSIVGSYSNLCVSLSQGTAVELERCDEQAGQQWSWR